MAAAYVVDAEDTVLQGHVTLGPSETGCLPNPASLVGVAHGPANLGRRDEE